VKVVVITGGSRGIGKAMARQFASKKWNVAICSRTKEELDETQNELNCYAEFCDVRFPDLVKKFFDSVIRKFGRIDVLITCSGILGPRGPLESNSLQHWKETMDANLLGTMYCVHYAIPIMKKQKFGRIITMCGGGVGGKKLEPGFSAYATSKFAVAGFVEAIGKELSFSELKINAISPGAVKTSMANERWVKGDSPEKTVKLAYFLATTDKDINGKVISAVWDDYENFEDKESLYTLRRVA